MCLMIYKKLNKKNTRKTVYKVLLQHPQTKELFSLYQYSDHNKLNYQYKLNEPYVSDRFSNIITDMEDLLSEISTGTHVFLNKHDTILKYINPDDFLQYYNGKVLQYYNGKVIKFNIVLVLCKVDPKDHVADGFFCGMKSAVYTKITPIKVIEVKNGKIETEI